MKQLVSMSDVDMIERMDESSELARRYVRETGNNSVSSMRVDDV